MPSLIVHWKATMAGKLPHPDEADDREEIVHMFGLFSKALWIQMKRPVTFVWKLSIKHQSLVSIPNVVTKPCIVNVLKHGFIPHLHEQGTFKVHALTAVPTTMMTDVSYALKKSSRTKNTSNQCAAKPTYTQNVSWNSVIFITAKKSNHT